jgi:hypothetical protein
MKNIKALCGQNARLLSVKTDNTYSNVTARFNHLNAGLNPIYHLLALLGAHHILHVSRIRVNVANIPCLAVQNRTKPHFLLLGHYKIFSPAHQFLL